ncbi:MAG: hypothetical protein ACI845_003234, partial [Gammaproteobacteria bacterium]
MSLLLDALKKAAEQKAKKDEAVARSTDEAVVRADISAGFKSDPDLTIDSTHLDHDQLESSSLDETEIKVPVDDFSVESLIDFSGDKSTYDTLIAEHTQPFDGEDSDTETRIEPQLLSYDDSRIE